MCLPQFTQADADAIITYRENNLANNDPSTQTDISWMLDLISTNQLSQTLITALRTGSTTAPNWGSLITGSSTVYSADIVTVSQDGRAFKRVKIVVDASSGTPQIVYRRDMTESGWPLDRAIRESLRNGHGLPDTNGSTSMDQNQADNGDSTTIIR
jgi:hypothetical protein